MRGVVLLVAAVAVVAVASGAAAGPGGKLPPEALRGVAHRLHQYPTLSLATPRQRAGSTDLLVRARARVRPWRDPRAGDGAGFEVDTRRTRSAGPTKYFHAESRTYSNDDVFLDPERPESLIYADVPGRPLMLVGVMFALRRGMHGPSPGGPITRWHWHQVCVAGEKRGLTPRPDGSCPPGARLQNGSEMMHIWFTRDLRSAFAIHAPQPELCAAGLLPHDRCGHGGHG